MSQTLRVNNWIIFRINNAKFSGSYFYMKTKIKGDFQICNSVSLIYFDSLQLGIQLNQTA